MANSRKRMWERAELRKWSEIDQDWVAPPYAEGGPRKHNYSTYSNWLCRCKPCKIDHNIHTKEGRDSRASN